jgi:hypothetical protein
MISVQSATASRARSMVSISERTYTAQLLLQSEQTVMISSPPDLTLFFF